MRFGWRRRRSIPRPTSYMAMRMFADVHNDKELIDRLGPHRDGESAMAVLDAAFQLVLRWRFGRTHDIAGVRGLVRGMQYFYLKEKVSSEDAETLIRAGLGEDIDTSHIAVRPSFLTKLVAFVAIVQNEMQPSDEQLFALLIEAEKVAEKKGYRPQQATGLTESTVA